MRELARVGHGIAILPTSARLDTEHPRMRPLMFRGRLMEVDLMILWGTRPRMPGYAQAFTEILAEHVLTIIPHSQAPRGTRGQPPPLVPR